MMPSFIEHKGNTAGCSDIALSFGKRAPYIGSRPVAVICQRINND